MTIQEYQKLTGRTSAKLDNTHMDASHYLQGIVGEWFTEVNSHSIKATFIDLKEVGDVFWYLSELANLLNHQLELKPLIEDNRPVHVTYSIGRINELYKKHMVYGNALDMDEYANHLNNIAFVLSMLTDPGDISERKSEDCPKLMECFDMNINKLKTRYPEKFSTEDALSRKDKQD